MQSSRSAALEEYALARERLVRRLSARGVQDERVLQAIFETPRHRFLPEALWGQAYRDTPVPIGEAQTISAPGVVATMTEALSLSGHEQVLEVGTGSGYQAALLHGLAASVLSIERIPVLAERADVILSELGCDRVEVRVGDGTQGAPDRAPFDRILVTAGGPELPLPLLSQLTVGGLLVGPFGDRGGQELMRIQRAGPKKFTREVLGACRFVDLIGEAGWSAPSL